MRRGLAIRHRLRSWARGLITAGLGALLLWVGSLAHAAPASLIADSLSADAQRLTAQGHVILLVDGHELRAQGLTYDQRSDRLALQGPLTLTSPDGTRLTAAQGQLDAGLRQGILEGARLVLRDRLQIAARTVAKEGPLTGLRQAAATSCQVCPGRAPLWEIRAREVVHDARARRIWFTDAQLNLRGTPLLTLPQISLPEPGVKRARGLLSPVGFSSQFMGIGVLLPYFLPLGTNRDITVTPHLATKTRGLMLRYREALPSGAYSLTGRVHKDDSTPGLRGYVVARGTVKLAYGVQIMADLEHVSDRTYLRDYSLDQRDRIDSEIRALRIGARDLSEARLTVYRSLRTAENNVTFPVVLGVAQHESRRPFLGGMARVALSYDSHLRRSGVNGPNGRDMARLGARAGWRGRSLLGPFEVIVDTDLRADYFRLHNAAPGEQEGTRLHSASSVGVAAPFIARSQGLTQVVTPRITFTYGSSFGTRPPNEDNTRLELDESNLHALTRLPGEDTVETGGRIAASLGWAGFFDDGSEVALTVGRLLQTTPQDGATPKSGLAGRKSDWVVAADLALPDGFTMGTRWLMAGARTPRRGETRLAWHNPRVDLAASHVFLSADPEEGRPKPVSELVLTGGVNVTPQWRISTDTRYDLLLNAPVSAQLGTRWRNECVSVALSASHRFISSGTVRPETAFGLTISLEGFSASPGGAAARACRH